VRSVVVVAEGDGKFRAAEVRTGIEAQGRTEILSGLGAGERVVVSGQFLIDSEASLTSALTRLEGSAGQPAGHDAGHEQ
jgi:Cu(I)/Ag(I) efflux system membrane fusion protein